MWSEELFELSVSELWTLIWEPTMKIGMIQHRLMNSRAEWAWRQVIDSSLGTSNSQKKQVERFPCQHEWKEVCTFDPVVLTADLWFCRERGPPFWLPWSKKLSLPFLSFSMDIKIRFPYLYIGSSFPVVVLGAGSRYFTRWKSVYETCDAHMAQLATGDGTSCKGYACKISGKGVQDIWTPIPRNPPRVVLLPVFLQ